ncbi:hypothetical protein LTR74_008307 [Friedmanniomyces endolithicus]|nr:hypothetical protein LTR74_008307 [Friedmanniomyces endolithicus]
MGKRTVYTKITALPENIPRQLALDMLHSHEEVIKLNPLVTGVKGIEAPRDARSDEFFSQWYEISEIITWGFGLRKKISFKGCFQSQPWGLQSHVYAPMGVDMRNKYRIGGNQPGEEREPRELGVNTPLSGLYLREDVEIVCGVPLTTSFVKKEAQAATGIMVDRMTRKAELIDAGKLHAMFQDGMLKTAKPSEEATFGDNPFPSPNTLPPGTPCSSASSPGPKRDSTSGSFTTPVVDERGYGRYHDVVARNASQRNSGYIPQYQRQGYQGPDYGRGSADHTNMPEVMELPGSFYQPDQGPQAPYSPGLYPPPLKSNGQQVFVSELPGDFIQPAQNLDQNTQPGAAYQAYQKPPTPQTTPNLPNRAASTSSSMYSVSAGGGGKYHVANPTPQQSQTPQQQYSAFRQTPPQNQQAFQQPQQTHPAFRQSSQSMNVDHRQQLPSQQQHQQQQQQQHPGAYRNSSASSAQVADWQRGLSTTTNNNTNNPEDPHSMRNSTTSYIEPDHQRFSQLSMQNTPPLVQHAQQPVMGRVAKCPVCGLFEGDEAAITHHVNKAHQYA